MAKKPSVSADGKSIVTTTSGGKAMATIPDICKVPCPPGGMVPIPFPNVAESKDIKGGSVTVKIDGGSVALAGSFCDKSVGDEAGVGGGVISGTTKGKAFFLNWSPTVIIEGRPVCRKGDMMLMNNGNTVSLSGMDQPDVQPPEPISTEEGNKVEFQLVDEESGKPLKRKRCMLIFEDGKIIKAKSDENGVVKRNWVPEGEFEVMLDSDAEENEE